jgi:3',5'-nucleoside bisphosphate phosphatase
MLADLHIHTTASDGIYTPEDIVKMAETKQLKAFAITDHDNMEGYIQAQRYIGGKKRKSNLICGVEIDTYFENKDVHILGYHVDPYFKGLDEAMKWIRNGRIGRIENMLAKLNSLGYKICQEEVVAQAKLSKSIGRPHIARVMVAKGYFKTEQEVFNTLIARGKPCFCQQEKLPPKDIVKLIHEAGGIACLAHPSELHDFDLVERVLNACNFNGIEVWHPSAVGCHEVEQWLSLAKKLKLLTSGGSDFHGNKDRYPLQLGEFKVFYNNVKNVVEWK